MLAIIDHLSIDISQGDAVGVMGRSGVGKSTLINLVAGYVRPTSGAIWEDEKLVVGPERSRVVVFQGGSLWPWLRLEKNVALGLGRQRNDPSRYRVMEALLERLGIAEARDAYPWELSGGMQKRAELARAILARPRVLMLDEALGSVDAVTKQVCIETIRDYRAEANAVVLVVSHELDEVLQLADRVVVLAGEPARVHETIAVAPPSAEAREFVRAQVLHALGYRG